MNPSVPQISQVILSIASSFDSGIVLIFLCILACLRIIISSISHPLHVSYTPTLHFVDEINGLFEFIYHSSTHSKQNKPRDENDDDNDDNGEVVKNKRGRGTDKTPVLAIVKRDGNSKAQKASGISDKTLKMSDTHLNRYIAEFSLRWNHRDTTDGECTKA